MNRSRAADFLSCISRDLRYVSVAAASPAVADSSEIFWLEIFLNMRSTSPNSIALLVVPFVVWASVVSPFILHARANASDIAFTNPAFAVHLAHLKKTVPKGFTVLVQPPFVVIGDEPPEMVRRRATGTVKWAVDKLKQDYFKRDPVEIIDIWLFRDQDSYTNDARVCCSTIPPRRRSAITPPNTRRSS